MVMASCRIMCGGTWCAPKRTVTIQCRSTIALLLSLATSACGGSGSSLPTTPTGAGTGLVSAVVSPSQLLVGDTGTASVMGWSSVSGQPIYGPQVVSTWTSSNSAVATVDNAGRVNAVSKGAATLTARYAQGTASTVVTVFSESDITVMDVVCPASATLPGGVFCTAAGRPAGGVNVPLRATWATSDPRIAVADPGSGPSSVRAIVGVAAGEVTVIATYRDLRATATVTFRN